MINSQAFSEDKKLRVKNKGTAAVKALGSSGLLVAPSGGNIDRKGGENDDACIDGVGLRAPSPMCSSENPCTEVLNIYKYFSPPITKITTPVTKPVCRTGKRGLDQKRPFFYDGAPKVINGFTNNIKRYWCEYKHPAASIKLKKPLVIFIHGSGGTAQGVYDSTSLRSKAADFDLTGRANNKGFTLVSLHSRNLRWQMTGLKTVPSMKFIIETLIPTLIQSIWTS